MSRVKLRHPVLATLLIAFVLNADEWSYLAGGSPLPPVLWVAALGLFALPRINYLTTLQHSHLLRFQSVLMVLALLLAVIKGAPRAEINAAIGQFGGMVFAGLCLLHMLRESVWNDVNRMLKLALVFGSLLMFLEFLGVLAFSKTGGRASGPWINPNLASLTLLGLIVAVTEHAKSAAVLVRSYLIAGAAIILSFSRGGILAAFLVGLRQLVTVGRVSVGGVAVGMLVLIPAWFGFVHLLPEELVLNANVAQRLAFLRGESSLSETGFGHRVELLEMAVVKARQSPIIGHGLAEAQSFSIAGNQLGVHNEFFSVLVAYGLIGLICFLGYLRALARLGLGTFVFYLCIISLFWHSLFLVREVLFLCAYFEAGAYHARSRSRNRNGLVNSVD